MLLIGEAVGLVMGRLLKYVCEPKIDLEIMFLGLVRWLNEQRHLLPSLSSLPRTHTVMEGRTNFPKL